MGQDWIQVGMFAATVGLVLVSFFGVGVSYFLLRSHVDPAVVVYTVHDERQPHILKIIIANVGPSPAFGVRFTFSPEIEREAANNPAKMTDDIWRPMRDGPLVDGIPLLGPGSRRVLTWGSLKALRGTFVDAPVRVSATYESRRSFPWDPTEHTSSSVLEIRSFLGTDASKPPELRGVEALENLATDMSDIRAKMRTLAATAEETGRGTDD